MYVRNKQMPRHIVKLKDRYAFWSTIVDAPVTDFLPLDEFMQMHGQDANPERMARVEATGTSAIDQTLWEVISFNRAGEDEESISDDELLERYSPEIAQPSQPRNEGSGE
jgi:hypothetical protein